MLETTTRPGTIPAHEDSKKLLPLVAAVLLFSLYAVLSIRRHQLGLTGGYDLGIYEQAVRHLAHLEAPRTLVDNEIFPRFIIVLLAPFYAVFPSPVTLLVAQAFLIAIGVIPLMAWAQKSLGTYAGIVIAFVYGVAPGIATAVGFDFHEIAFAVPLIAWSMSALGQEQWRRAVYWALPLVLVKEDLGLTVVAAVGIYVFCHGERKLGLLTAVFGVTCTAITMLVIFPAISKTGGYFVADNMFPHTIGGLLETGFSGLGLKVITVVAVLGPTLIFALKSPIVLIALPTLGARFFTDNEYFWYPTFHYDAVLVPIVTAAFIHGIRRTPKAMDRRNFLSAALITTGLLACFFDFNQLTKSTFWTDSRHAQAIHQLVDLVPDDAQAAASSDIMPQLTSRTTVVWFGSGCDCGPAVRPGKWQSADWIIVDTELKKEFKEGNAAAFDTLLADGFSLVAEADGIRLARRDQRR